MRAARVCVVVGEKDIKREEKRKCFGMNVRASDCDVAQFCLCLIVTHLSYYFAVN